MPVLELNLPHCCIGDLNFCRVIQGRVECLVVSLFLCNFAWALNVTANGIQ